MKKTFATFTFALVLTFGATFANAGIIVSDIAATPSCTSAETINDGIIIFGFVIFGKETKECTDSSKTGIIVSDFANTGILISD